MNFGLKSLLTVFSIGMAGHLAVSATKAQEAVPTWELGKKPIDSESVKGMIELVDGVVKLDCTNSFEIPAAALGKQEDYTIEVEFRRSPAFKNLPLLEGALLLFSNRDEKSHAGLTMIYFPPEWDKVGGVGNHLGIDVNGYWNGETHGLEGEGFNKYTVVVKNRLASIYRNGLLLAMTGEIKPSQAPLTVGGRGWRNTYGLKADSKPLDQPYELRSLKIYDSVQLPAGYDKSAEMMRNVAGEGYSMQRADVKDPSLPRILVIGDSISMGYRGFITRHFKDKAYVDYWVGGGWLDPNSVKGEDSKVKTSWKGVLSNGPYDVISWNSMTLHMWNGMPGRCPEDSYPANMTEVVEFLKKTAPDTKFIWIRCTPCTTTAEGKPVVINMDRTERIIRFNKMTDEIMSKYGIPEVDLYALCEKNLDKASKDGVHWNQDASQLMADEVIKTIGKLLPEKHRQDSGK